MKMRCLILIAGILGGIGIDAAEAVKSTHVYKTVEALEIKAEVYSYGDDRVRPVVVWLHGGALINGGRQGISGRIKQFARDNGYVLVSFDYRLAPETQLPAIIEDLEDAFKWLIREGPRKFNIDPQRVAVTGGSAGGYLTLTSGFRVKPAPTVLLSFWGYGDLVGAWYAEPSPHPRHNRVKVSEMEARAQVQGPAIANSKDRNGTGLLFYIYCRQSGGWPTAVTGWNPHAEPEKFYAYMPVMNVDPEYPPTAMIHGTLDTDVPFAQSEMMVKEFKKHGVAHMFLAVSGGEHGLGGADRAEIDTAYAKAFAFVKARLEE